MWIKNITEIDLGKFRTVNGNADELIAIGRVIKAGFACSKVEISNGKYDAVIDLGHKGQLIRVQIKGTGSGVLALTGGGRSGQQISREVEQRTYKYTKEDCDMILGIDSDNGDIYIMPIEDTESFGNTVSLARIADYKENWGILVRMSKEGRPETNIEVVERSDTDEIID
jgi:hypothetical protein